ncbi:MAG: DHA2 family efflux MFS transporter permease subunit [Hyphomicrobiaceae bacterium]|nr:DHA2 family efflux MFS transporter permease subunit [Hyphomicrobiaceae bacterium]
MGSISPRQWLILFMVQLATMLNGMTITLANVVLPQIKGAMSATPEQIAWVVTFNLVGTAAATLLTGWLSRRLGWRNVMFVATLGLTLFSFLCGMAQSLEALVLFRVGQGLFGAPIMPMGQAILLASFPRHLHPFVMMLWGIGGVIGPVTGPVLGSIISEATNWRGAFFMVVPPGIIATAIVWLALSKHTERSTAEFDWTGFIALSLAIGSAQLMLDRGHRLDWFDSTEIVVEALLAAIAFWVFLVHSLTAKRPFLDLGVLLDRNFAIGLLLVFVLGMLSFTPMVLFPGLLHDLRGYPDDAIGMLLAGRGFGNWACFLIIVPMTKHYPRLTVATGLAAQAVSGFAMARLDINLTQSLVFWTNFVQGFGFGLAFTPLSVLTFATLPVRQMTEGMAIYHLVRNFGSSIFISISILLLVRSSAANYAGLTEVVTHFNKTLALPEAIGLWSTATPRGLLTIAGEIQRQSAMIGYINAFYLFAMTAAVAAPFAWIMRSPPPAQHAA